MIATTSRTGRFARSLISGYALMGTTMAYSLVTVPIALHYLSRAEFGLWALITQLTGYLALVDLGMSGSIARTLVDHKDDRHLDIYGSLLQTGFLVNIVQGGIIILVGIGCGFWVGDFLKVELGLQSAFFKLIVCQSTLLGLGFMLRSLNLLFSAHQRYDILNSVGSMQLMLNAAVLWIGFHLQAGIYSLVWAYAASLVFSNVLYLRAAFKLRLFPDKNRWGAPTWPLFRELFSFGKDVFLFVLGSQLTNASQVILITRILGLEAGAVWAVCTRTFTLLSQSVFKIFDYSSGALAEMMVRNERSRLLERFRSITIFSTSLAAFVAIMMAVCNGPFVAVWTNGRISWPMAADSALACLLLFQVVARTHIGLVGQTKNFEILRYVYFLEGLFFISLSTLVLPTGGMTAMIGASVAGTLLFSLPTGVTLTSRYFDLKPRTVFFDWSRPAFRLIASLAPLAFAAHWACGSLPMRLRLAAIAVTVGLPGIVILLRVGLDRESKNELLCRVPFKKFPIVGRLIG